MLESKNVAAHVGSGEP